MDVLISLCLEPALSGGAGIVLGLALYGWQIMRVFGVKSVKLTNSRGFCLELATAITVILSSRYGK
jgi:solute carrier family 20 (sodium-dependent phosphate transporter)